MDCSIAASMNTVADSSSIGPFAISYKVPGVREGIRDLDVLGYFQIKYLDFGSIQKTLFDTKNRLGL